MTVYFLNDDEDEMEICSILYTTVPCFVVGQTIAIRITNVTPDVWDVDDMQYTKFEITRISHEANKFFGTDVRFDVIMFVFLKRLT